MFKFRIITFPLLLALLAAMVFWKEGGPWLFSTVAVLAGGAAGFELSTMLESSGISSWKWVCAVVCAILMAFCIPIPQVNLILALGPFALWMLGVLTLGGVLWCAPENRKKYLQRYITTLGIILLIAMTMVPLAIIYTTMGAYTLLCLVLITKAGDTGGYIFGMLSSKLPGGNHKIVPSISPKKSWEGTLGGLALSIGVAFALSCWSGSDVFYTMSPLLLAVVGALLFCGSFAGDLTESSIKRACNVKDSGHYLPGMGGIWDVIDSFLYNAPLFFLVYTVWVNW